MAKVIGFELNSQDPEKAAEFYSNVFGWEIEEPNWGYWPVKIENDKSQAVNGGISKGPNDYPHGHQRHEDQWYFCRRLIPCL